MSVSQLDKMRINYQVIMNSYTFKLHTKAANLFNLFNISHISLRSFIICFALFLFCDWKKLSDRCFIACWCIANKGKLMLV